MQIMRSIECALAISVSMLISGCTFPRYDYKPVGSDISKPPIGQVTTAYVGEELLAQGTVNEYEAVRLPVDSVIKQGINLGAGVYLKMGSGKTADFYTPSLDTGAKVMAPATVQPGAIQVSREGQRVCVLSTEGLAVCNRAVRFERIKFAVARADSFQQTLLYNGRVGNKINIAYRESSGNLARPAFSNAVEYDIAESKTIGYKGARLEIIEATNELIRYRVLENFNAGR